MTGEVFIIGIHSTPAGRFPDRPPKDLVRETYLGALADARIEPVAIGQISFGSTLLDFWGHANVKGQVWLLRLVTVELLPAGIAAAV
ncbi:MAG: hypothetical protein WA192_13860 [Candidatus Acidiferrales bacterium]